jgi:hypothetical protein
MEQSKIEEVIDPLLGPKNGPEILPFTIYEKDGVYGMVMTAQVIHGPGGKPIQEGYFQLPGRAARHVSQYPRVAGNGSLVGWKIYLSLPHLARRVSDLEDALAKLAEAHAKLAGAPAAPTPGPKKE